MSTPLVIIVGADKGGVGKTTIARAMDDYVAGFSAKAKKFDAEYPNGDLKRFSPDAAVVDMRAVGDQMRVFDSVSGVTLIDARAGLLSALLDALNEVRLLDDVKEGKLNLVLLQVVGPTMGSLSEVSSATKALGTAARHFLVKNHINEGGYFEWSQGNAFHALFEERRNTTINVPQLTPRATETLHNLHMNFNDFANNGAQSRMLRGYVRAWLDIVWGEFSRVGLGELIRGAI